MRTVKILQTALYYCAAIFLLNVAEARQYDSQVGRFLSEDPLEFEGGDVNFFRYVANNPINWIDPFGLVHYNAPPPQTVPVQGETLQDLNCVEQCLQAKTINPNLDLLVTGGAEQSGHSRNSDHYKGEACDIHGSNAVENGDVMKCAAKCGFGAGQFENYPDNRNRNHWHLQLSPDNGVPSLPGSQQPRTKKRI